MRVKFQSVREPNENEMKFIGYISGTGDEYGIKEDTLALFLNVSTRKVREYKELYNCFKFTDIVLKGRIHNVNGRYRLIRPNSKYAAHYRLKARFNKLCGILDDYYAGKTLGDIQAKGQISFDNQLYAEQDLINLALEYELILDRESKL